MDNVKDILNNYYAEYDEDGRLEKDQDKAIKEAIKLSEEIGKMSKKEREEFNKNRESKISTDYVIDNFIQTSINIKKWLKA